MSTGTQPEQVPSKFCDGLDALGATILAPSFSPPLNQIFYDLDLNFE